MAVDKYTKRISALAVVLKVVSKDYVGGREAMDCVVYVTGSYVIYLFNALVI